MRVGRKAETAYVIWRPKAKGHFPWRCGEYVELPPEIAGVYEALRYVFSVDALSIKARLLALDPRSNEGQREIAALTDKAEEMLRRQGDVWWLVDGVPTRMSGGLVEYDPFWLLKKYRRKQLGP